jgi:hypothetical protein
MKKPRLFASNLAFAFMLGLVVPISAQAVPVLANGGFETGLGGWSRVDQLSSDGTFYLQSGTTSPVAGDPVPAPPQGINAAMTDQSAGGSHALYQDFTASAGPATLSFSLYVGNRANAFYVPGHLDWAGADLNQQARVDILRSGADDFSIAAADVLLSLFSTQVGDPLVSGYTTYSFDVTSFLGAHAGETLRLRFVEVDNVAPFQFGVDDVRFDAVTPVPEPETLVLLGTGLAALLGRFAKRRRGRGIKGE